MRSEAIRNAVADVVVRALDGGHLEFYDADDADPVLRVPFGSPAFETAKKGVARARALPPTFPERGGALRSFRARSRSGAVVLWGTVGPAGSGATLELSLEGEGSRSMVVKPHEAVTVAQFIYAEGE